VETAREIKILTFFISNSTAQVRRCVRLYAADYRAHIIAAD